MGERHGGDRRRRRGSTWGWRHIGFLRLRKDSMQTIACRAVRQALLFALATTLVLSPEAALAGKQDKTTTPPRSVAKTAKPKVVLGAFVGPKAAEVRKWAHKGLAKATNLK